jgi:hypothetical protein
MIKNHILAGCHELTDTQKAFIGAQQSDWQAPVTGLGCDAAFGCRAADAVSLRGSRWILIGANRARGPEQGPPTRPTAPKHGQ